MSFIERYRAYHLFLSDMVEDILATTLLLPLTIALHSWNSVADSLIEIPYLQAGFSTKVWKIGRFGLTAPLYALKGVLGLTVLPIAALSLAIPEQPDDAVWKNYHYPLGHLASELLNSLKFRIQVILIATFILDFDLSEDLLGNYFYPVLAALFLGGATISVLADSLLTLNSAYVYTMLLIPLYTPYLSLLLNAPLSVSLGIGFAALTGWVDAKTSFLTTKIRNGLEHLQDFIKIKLFKNGQFSFKNKEDIVGDPLTEISEDQLLITNTGYALNIEHLSQQFETNGFKNPHIENRNAASLSLYEVEKIERLSGLKRFPQLKKYIEEHKKELSPANLSGISSASLIEMSKLAYAMRLTQHDNTFAEKMAQAADVFETHMKSISPEEKTSIENVNLLGGNDSSYKFKNVTEAVFRGEWCKKGAATLILETCDRINHTNKSGQLTENRLFWQKPHPTHWMRRGRILIAG